jgi:hypothetical protein
MPSEPPNNPPTRAIKPKSGRGKRGHAKNADNDNFAKEKPVPPPPVWAIELAKALARYRAGVAYREGS